MLEFVPLEVDVVKDAAATERILIFRAKVPGGWLVLASSPIAGSQQQSVTFVPDVSHEWDGGSLP